MAFSGRVKVGWGMAKKFYHLSPVKFTSFAQQRKGGNEAIDVGVHLGTKRTALTVADMLYQKGRIRIGDTVYLYDVSAKLDKCLFLVEDRLGSWSADRILSQIFEGCDGGPHPFVTRKEEDLYWEDVVKISGCRNDNLKDQWIYEEEKIAALAKWLKKRGVTCIKYKNVFEGGGISYIVLDPSTVRINSVTPYLFER